VGLSGLVASAREYLEPLADDHRGVNLGVVRAYLDAMHADPEVVERVAPPAMTHKGTRVDLADLDFDAAAIAAAILAEEHDRYAEAVIERATAYARGELEEAGDGRFVALVMDFAADPDNRDLVYRRLERHVERVDAERGDVEGLFDDGVEREGPSG
jgi:hypothetical protein